MGKRDKEHRKRVQKRNNQIKGAEKAYEKLKKHLQQLVEEHKQNTSGMTENSETTNTEEGVG